MHVLKAKAIGSLAGRNGGATIEGGREGNLVYVHIVFASTFREMMFDATATLVMSCTYKLQIETEMPGLDLCVRPSESMMTGGATIKTGSYDYYYLFQRGHRHPSNKQNIHSWVFGVRICIIAWRSFRKITCKMVWLAVSCF